MSRRTFPAGASTPAPRENPSGLPRGAAGTTGGGARPPARQQAAGCGDPGNPARGLLIPLKLQIKGACAPPRAAGSEEGGPVDTPGSQARAPGLGPRLSPR